MKISTFTLSWIAGALGLALGLLIESQTHKSKFALATESIPVETKKHNPSTKGGGHQENTNAATKTKAFDRGEVQKFEGPQISIPHSNMEKIIKNAFIASSDFNRLEYPIQEILPMLGVADSEKNQLLTLIKKLKSDMLTAEKTHIKVSKVTEDSIQLDRRSMREPAEAIINQLKSGIRSTLPRDMAETLISNINWKEYYNTDEFPYIDMEVTRTPSGKLFAFVKDGPFASGASVDANQFKDDGTPLPAEQIFEDEEMFAGRWSPLVKGLFILPKSE